MDGPDRFLRPVLLVTRSLTMPLVAISQGISYLEKGRIGSLILVTVAVPLSVAEFLKARKAYLNPFTYPLPERPWYYQGERERRVRKGVRYRIDGAE